MIGRSVDEWIGPDADQAIPKRVKLRVWEREGGKCHRCTRKIRPGEAFVYEHVHALILGGENRENNIALSCAACGKAKTAEEMAFKAKSDRIKARHLGITAPKRKLQSRGFPRTEPQHTATSPIRRET